MPGAFKEQSMLRVRQLRLARAHSKEWSVELIDVVEDWSGSNVVGMAQQCGINAGRHELFVREGNDGFLAGAQVAPELVDVPGTWHTRRHTDDGDAVRCRFIRFIRGGKQSVGRCRKRVLARRTRLPRKHAASLYVGRGLRCWLANMRAVIRVTAQSAL